MTTQRSVVRSTRALRACAAFLLAVVFALMNGDRPAGQQTPAGNALQLNGTSQYVTFGQAAGTSALGVTNFTLELWFNWTGGGTAAGTGNGGLASAYPLLTKGTAQAETPANLNMNYFLGISGGKLAADFEDTANGGNHPVIADTTITTGVWHHAAATYDVASGTWKLYLDGNLDKTLALGASFTPESTSIQHAALGAALTSTPATNGLFAGIVDEARIWNVVRTQAEIQANKNVQLTSGTGLIGRWGLNEASGTTATNSIAARPNGTLVGTPTRVAGFPIPDSIPPTIPQNVVANTGNGLVTVAWSANTEVDLASYNIFRNGSSTRLNTTPITTPIFTDNTVTNGQAYTYVVTAVDTSNNESAASSQVAATPHVYDGASMQFNGSSQYVTFGQANGAGELGLTSFTLETWFKRTGAGIATSTGNGGVVAVPLITKGMAETEAPADVNMNYFLGIRSTDNVLVADFEDTATGGNHPVEGTTPIPISTTAWHHVAVTFADGEWNLYLDGNNQRTLNIGAFTPESTSRQHAVIASALNSTGGIGSQTQGFFNGLLDEVRIWNYARSQTEIQAAMNQEIFAGPVARLGMNEINGTVVVNSSGSINGTAVGTPRLAASYPFPPDSIPPAIPTGVTASGGNAQVTVNWNPNSEIDFAGYNVFRRTAATTFGAPINNALLTNPAYVDTTAVNETEYFYAVSAVDVFNNSSGLSNETSTTPSANPAPIVNAGPDRSITFSTAATLSGSASDNGPFTVEWTKVSGPGTVAFVNANAASTTATFTAAGQYVLRLTANDGAKSAFDEMTVNVNLVLLGAGDVAPNCIAGDSLTNAQATATLLDGLVGPVFTLGDNSYTNGTAAEFATCFTPTWGRPSIKSRTRPVTGNHDYNTANATGYFDFFNGNGVQNGPAGDRSLGYYSYDLGNWHIVVLNSECPTTAPAPPQQIWLVNGCAAGSAQEQWLRNDLANSPTNNIIAMWHRPRYTSSSDDDEHAYVQPLWQALYDYGTDIYLGGHWHNYERLGPMNASGAPDNTFGIRTFVIGTGGVPVSGAFPNLRTTSEVRNNTAHGVMKFTLHDTSYDWEFIPVPGDTFTDSGTANVHGAPGNNQPPVVDAGADQTIGSGSAELNGSVTDDGPFTSTWSQVSGPGSATAVFGSPSSLTTSIGFPAAGQYVLRLTANDGLFVRSDTVTFNVTAASGNLPPTVNAGPDQFATLPNGVTLSGTVSDDGQPGPDTDTTWTNQSPSTGTVTFDEATSAVTTATFSAPGTYVLRLTANDGELSGFDEMTVTVNPVEVNRAIDFGGSNAYVTFGEAPGLGVSAMTIEAWFRRDGEGVTADTGSGGFLAVPIVAKGRAQDETSTNNMNFFLGIIGTTDVLAADFEDSATGLNHPVVGTTPIAADGQWHHAAATYDGNKWFLYLDGVKEAELPVGAFTPRFDSKQHASIGSALNTSGAAAGFFDGAIDEVRIWDRALTLAELQARINQPIPSAPNLVARWGLNEANGTAVNDSTAGPVNGTIAGSAFARITPGAPFNLVFNQAPNQPVLNEPSNGAVDQLTAPALSVHVSDPEGTNLNVTFFGRVTNAVPGGDFTIVALPDTQHYSDDVNRAPTFTAQTNWILNTKAALNTKFVSHLGDIVENIDNVPVEWDRADASMKVLDDGQMPYGIAPGNHDENSAGVATNYDLKFPPSRMNPNTYGGYLGQNLFNFTDPINRLNKNNFSLFSAGGMDFVVIHLEYDMPTYAVAWANRVLAAYPNRRAIIATHLFLNTSAARPTTVLNRTTDGTPAATVWTNLVFNNCNVFLVLNGHYPGEANRTDLNACGQPVHQLLSDYQSRTNGGDGWLRYMTFKPSENKIYVYTYSPTLNGGAGQFESDANSQFVLDYNMAGTPFTEIATNSNVTSDSDTQTTWAGRAPNTQYEWYATVSDGNQTVTGPTWSFTTTAPANIAPVAGDDTASTAEDTAVTVSQATLIANDTDANGNPLTVTAASNGTNGTAVRNANGSVTFTPAANFNGTAGFDYTVSDGTLTDIGHVTLTVTPVNDAPVAVDDTASTNEDTAVTVTQATMVANDTDPEGTALTVTAASNATGGTAVRQANGSVIFTPTANFSGTGGFDYTVSDGTLTDIGHVTVTVNGVNDPPVAVDDTTSTPEDTPNTRTQAQLVANDTDPDGNTLVVTAASNSTNGTAVRNADGSVTFTPTPNFSGTAGYDYTVSDGTVTDIGHVTVTVTPVNDAPVAVDDTASTNEDTPVTVTQATMVANDTDVEGSTRTVTAVSNPTNGTAVRNATTGAITFTPAANFSGTGGFDYTVSDGALTDVGHVTVTVNPVNDAPVAVDDTTTTPEDTAETRTQANLVANDTDADGNTLVVTAASNPTNGTVLRNADGSVTFTPAANFSGTAGYDYTVSDGTLTDIGHVTVTVTAVNDAPVAVDDTASTAVGTPLTLTQANLKGNDTDVDNTNAQLTVTEVSTPINGTVQLVSGSAVFTPTAGFTGTAGFDYTISDGTLTDIGHVTVNVTNGPNVAPVAVDDGASTAEDTAVTVPQASMTANDTDANGNTLVVTAASNATNGSAVRNADGSVTFTPAANFSGTAGFDYTVSDGALTDIGHVTVTVTPVNDPPVANAQSVSTVQGIPVNITLTGSDPDGGVPNFAVMTQPTNGTVSGTAPNITYTPAAGYLGGDSFTFRTSDATTNSAPATVSITVNPPVSFTPLGVGTHFPTTDNADQGGGPGPRAITPPLVQLGDMVVIVAAYRGTATLTMAQTGGQVWTAEPNTQANGLTTRVFWSQFNGFWTANPSVTNTTGTEPLTVYSFAVDMAPGTYPEIDVPFLSGNHTGGTVTVPSFNTNTPGAFALAGWISIDNNTWSAPPAGWTAPGGQVQWRNSNGSDNTIALAYRNMTAAGATGTIARTQTVNGPDSGVYFRMAFKATYLNPPTAPDAPANLQASASIGQVSLTWQDNASNEFAYQIERCANAGCSNFAPLAGVGSNVTSFNDLTVAPTTTYRYQVRATNVIGNSQYSNTADATTPTPPFVFRGVGTHFPTVENADQGGGPGPRAITPPVVQLGDLVVIVAAYRGTATLTLSQTGGQVWTSETNTQANGVTVRVFWCQFNGVWAGNPAVTNTTGTSPLTAYSFAYDLAPGLYPDIDVPFATGNHTGGTVTVPSFNTNTEGALALAGFISPDNNTWSAPSAGWSTPGGQAQWRNSNGSDSSIALAYRLTGPAGPTGTIVRTQSASGPDSGVYFRMAFRGLPVPSNPPGDPTNLQATPSVGQVALTWADGASNEAGFNIERCIGVGCTNFAPLTVLGPNVTSYTDTNLAGTTTYRYQVRAYNLSGPSGYSNIADAETPAAPPPPPIPFTFRSVGTHYPTADNTNGTGPGPRAVTPPATLQAGDLYVIVAAYRGNTTLTLSSTGGQTWTTEANTQTNNVTARVFWTRFNGTWAGTPAVTNTTGTEALTVYNFAFAMSAGTHPEIDVAFASGSHSGGNVTVPSFTTNAGGTLALVGWLSDENNSWTAPTAGWSIPGGQSQWRNTQGEDTSLALAYRVFTSAGPTGTVLRSQTDGPDVGLYFRIAWKQVAN